MKMLVRFGAAALLLALPSVAQAVEINLGDMVPTSSATCSRDTLPADGRKLSVQQYQALYSLFSNHYGGDGKREFALPDLNGHGAKTAQSGQSVHWCVVTRASYPPRPN